MEKADKGSLGPSDFKVRDIKKDSFFQEINMITDIEKSVIQAFLLSHKIFGSLQDYPSFLFLNYK